MVTTFEFYTFDRIVIVLARNAPHALTNALCQAWRQAAPSNLNFDQQSPCASSSRIA